MNERHPENAGSERSALSWARHHFPFEKLTLLRRRPWARTYELQTTTERAFLKIVPSTQRALVQRTRLIAERFQRQVPRVIASSSEQGWLLSADHGGDELTHDAAIEQAEGLVCTYADIQCHTHRDEKLLSNFAQPDLQGLVARLLAFLNDEGDNCVVGAGHFMGRSAASYCDRLARRQELLERHIASASVLPSTLNHGDLRLGNAALLPDGSCVIFDWDDAFVGPAGMSLHGLFSGALNPTLLLIEGGASALAAAGPWRARLLSAYLEALIAGGYAESGVLRDALPGSICAGVIQYLLSFSNFPTEREGYRKAVARSMLRRLDDLLDLCDFLAGADKSTTLAFARDHFDSGDHERAANLLGERLAAEPDDPQLLEKLALVLSEAGRSDEAVAILEQALERQPEQLTLRTALGYVQLRRSNIEEAQHQFAKVLASDPTAQLALKGLARAEELPSRAREQGTKDPNRRRPPNPEV